MGRISHIAAVGLTLALTSTVRAQVRIDFVETVRLPDLTTDQHGAEFTITGMSGVTWLGADGYAAVLDNSDKLVLFDLDLAADGSVVSLANVRGLRLAASGDHEGVAFDGTGVLVSDESSMRVREFALADGALVREIDTPPVFASRRNNLGLESLAFDPDWFWTANEEALIPDGGRASPSEGTTVRLLRMRSGGGEPVSQHAYAVEPMHGPAFPFGNPGQSGLCDLVALPDGTLLSLERSLALASPLFLTRMFRVDAAPSDDVSSVAGLDGASFAPSAKTLVYTGGHANLEGLCLGPRLSPGAHALIGVVDDGDPLSFNDIVVLTVRGFDACAADVDGDGGVDIDDLYELHQHPVDIDGDGVADSRDRACLSAYLRRHERWSNTR